MAKNLLGNPGVDTFKAVRQFSQTDPVAMVTFRGYKSKTPVSVWSIITFQQWSSLFPLESWINWI